MSEYSYEERPRHRHRTREPEYVSETTYIERGGKGGAMRDLVYRPREDSIEDIPRDFPPPGAEYRQRRYRETYEPPRRTRSVNPRDYEYDDVTEYSYGGRDRGRRRSEYEHDSYYSDDYKRPRPRRRKSVVDNIKDIGEGLGLGGVIGAVAGRSRSRSRHGRHRGYDSEGYDRYDRRHRRYSSSSRSRSGGRHGRIDKKWEQAAKAAVVAGAVEAFRSRKDPGPWTGDKGQRIATAALGAAGIDSLVDKDPEHKSKRHVAEAAIGGLLANRFANGSRSRSRGRGRSQSRSQSRTRSRSRSIFGRKRSQSRGREHSRIRDVAGAGAALAAGKALYDRVRSKSRPGRQRSRSRSVSSEDSYVPSRARGTRYNRRRGGVDDFDGAGGRRGSADRGAHPAKARDGNESDSESTTDMENKRKKMRAPYPTTYADGNPYGAVPPPPIGPPPAARY